MASSERVSEFENLVCRKCGGQLHIYVDGLACSRFGCGGILSPISIGSKLTLKQLREEFSGLFSVSRADIGGPAAKDPEPSPLRQRSATAKQLKSIDGQLSLID